MKVMAMKRMSRGVGQCAWLGGIVLLMSVLLSTPASGNTYYYTDLDSNPRLNNTVSWSTDPDDVIEPATSPGANTDLIFNMNTLNTASTYAHMGGSDRHYNSFTFRSSGGTDILRTRIDNPSETSDSLLIVGAGGIALNEGVGAVNFGGDGQRVFMRADGSQSILNNSSSDLTFHWQYRSHTTVSEGTTTTVTTGGSGSGGIAFSRLIDGSGDRPVALTINHTGSGMTTLGETGVGFPHNYTGDTTVQAGLLRIDGTVSDSDVTVQDGGRIGGTGTIVNDVHFEAGGQFEFTPAGPLNVDGEVTFDAFGVADVVANWNFLPLNTSLPLIDGSINVANVSNVGAVNAGPVGVGRQAYFEEASLSMVILSDWFEQILIGAGIRNGDFNEDDAEEDTRTFAQTPVWINIGTHGDPSGQVATRTNSPTADGSRYAVITSTENRVMAQNTAYDIQEGDHFRIQYEWSDGFNFSHDSDRIEVRLFVTDNDTIGGEQTVVASLLSRLNEVAGEYQWETAVTEEVDPAWVGKRLFVQIVVDSENESTSFAHLDNFELVALNPEGEAPEPEVVSISIVGDALTLSATGVEEITPSVEYTLDLVNPDWQSITPTSSDIVNGTTIWTFDLGAVNSAVAFFRVVDDESEGE